MPNLNEQKILNWVSDFCQSDSVRLFPAPIIEHAQLILETLLREASQQDVAALEALTEDRIRRGLLEGVARLGLPEESGAFVPSLCRAFLEDLQRRGRIGNGLTLGRYVGALKEAYLEASASKASTFQRPGEKIGRNDPCPCGSGKKYKKCCAAKGS